MQRILDPNNLAKQERKLIFQEINRRFPNNKEQSGFELAQKAFEGHYVARADDFKNMGKGTLDRSRAKLIYEWYEKITPSL